MRKTISFAAAALAMASAGAAAECYAELATTGETTNCISLRRIDNITAADDSTFLVRVGAETYVNRTNSACHGATKRFNRLQYQTTSATLCRNDIITIVDNNSGMMNGSCSLGEFEKLTETAS